MTSNIKTMYRKLENDRVHQGDILKDFDIPFIISKPELSTESTKPPYSIIISQDCDLDGISKINDSLNNKSEEELINGNKFLPSIIIAPLYEADEINQGNYLSDFGLQMDYKGSKNRTRWKDILKNNNPRYHYLKGFNKDEEGFIVDFKIFYSIPYEYIKYNLKEYYWASLNELYREDLSDRFFNYHSRIGLP